MSIKLGRANGWGARSFTHQGISYKIERRMYKQHGNYVKQYRLINLTAGDVSLGIFTSLTALKMYLEAGGPA